jgi:hypothetical protein
MPLEQATVNEESNQTRIRSIAKAINKDQTWGRHIKTYQLR